MELSEFLIFESFEPKQLPPKMNATQTIKSLSDKFDVNAIKNLFDGMHRLTAYRIRVKNSDILIYTFFKEGFKEIHFVDLDFVQFGNQDLGKSNIRPNADALTIFSYVASVILEDKRCPRLKIVAPTGNKRRAVLYGKIVEKVLTKNGIDCYDVLYDTQNNTFILDTPKDKNNPLIELVESRPIHWIELKEMEI